MDKEMSIHPSTSLSIHPSMGITAEPVIWLL
jgi:hypothetical protein